MNRREFSVGTACLLATAALGLPGAVFAQSARPRDGAEYLTLDKPVSVDVAPGKIEVVEFFWYNCPHCNAFEPQFEAWTKQAPKYVTIRRVPVAFRPDFEPQQRLYYVLEAMGKLDELHKKVFHTIHVEKLPMNTGEVIAGWAEKQGIPKAKFVEMYNSFSVSTKVRKATQLQDIYKVDGVPALGVAGRYYTSSAQAQSMTRALEVAEYLIAASRKQ